MQLAQSLKLTDLLSGIAILSGVASLFLIGNDGKFAPMAVGAVSSTIVCARSLKEGEKSQLEQRLEQLQADWTAKTEQLEREYQERQVQLEAARLRLLEEVQQREEAIDYRLQDLEREREEQRRQLEEQQAKLNQEYDQRLKLLEQERDRLLHEVDGQRGLDEDYLRREREQLERDRKEQQGQIAAQWEQLNKSRDEDYKFWQQMQERLNKEDEQRRNAVEEERNRLHAELEKIRAGDFEYLRTEQKRLDQQRQEFEAAKLQIEEELNLRQQQDLAELEKQRQAIEAQFEQLRDQLEQEFQQREAELLESLQAELADREEQIAFWQQRATQARYKTPTGKHGYAGWIGGKVQQALARYEIYLSWKEGYLRGDEAVLVFEPIEGCEFKLHKIRACLEETKVLAGFGMPEIETDDEVVQFSVALSPEKLPPTAKVGTKQIEITEPEGGIATYMRTYIKRSERLSAAIFGDSGAGKSTLVNNVCCLIKRELGDDAEIIIIDPKAPDTPWQIDGVLIEPDYQGINDPDEDPDNWLDPEIDCHAGFQAMKRDVMERLRAKRVAKRNGKAMPKFPKRIWIIDEAEEMFAVYGMEFAKAVLRIARLGRSIGLAVVIIGQSGNCKAYGFMNSQLKNFIRVYLRDAVPLGIAQNNELTAEKRPLQDQHSARKARVVGLDLKHPWRFWGYFQYPGEPGFVAQLPEPNAFSRVGVSVAPPVPRDEEAEELEPDANPFDTPDVLDLIEEAKAEERASKQDADRLNRLLNQSNKDAIIRGLDEPLKVIYEYCSSKPGEWVGSSELKQKRSAGGLKSAKKEQVWLWFERLAELGLGEYEKNSKRFRV